ncbi:MAG: RDD family protein [Gaiellales bacterium]
MALQPPEPEPAAALYSGWSRRAGAWLLDYLIVSISLGIGQALLGQAFLWLGVALIPAYWGVWQSQYGGQTIGKRVAGIAVRRAGTLATIGFWRSMWRSYFPPILSVFSFGVGWLVDVVIPLTNTRHQALHDMVADTVVVRVSGANPRGTRP